MPTFAKKMKKYEINYYAFHPMLHGRYGKRAAGFSI
jgi:hypothetical protein